jgi:hypothetical protein
MLPLTLNCHNLHSVLTEVTPSPLLLTGSSHPATSLGPHRWIITRESRPEIPMRCDESHDVTAKVSLKTDDIWEDRTRFGFRTVPVRSCPIYSLLPCGRKLLCSFAASDAHCFGGRPSRLFIRTNEHYQKLPHTGTRGNFDPQNRKTNHVYGCSAVPIDRRTLGSSSCLIRPTL